ncbi:MAG: type II toxin-antitoxin system PemK/MazF family toxin [Synergistaceae bacterium]|nr:type II toxin-antitoxin system PemK/MazF family toxin [Synergistaceae bacterium]
MFLLNYKYQEVKKISRLKISKILKSSSASASAGRKNNNKSHRKNELIKILQAAKKKQAVSQAQAQAQSQAKCDNNECLNQLERSLEQSAEIVDTVCEKKSEAAKAAITDNVDNVDNVINNSVINADKDVAKKDNTSTGESIGGSSKTYQVNVLQAHRLEIWFANLGFNQGKYNETGVRPVLILSNDIANTVSPIVTVAPMTSRLHKLYLPTHVLIYPWEVSDVNAANNVEQHSTKGHYHKRHYHRHSYKRNQEYQRRQSRQSRQLYSRLGCVLLEQITLLDKRQLRNCIGKVTSPERIKILNDAIKDFLVLV